jgi:hypothetical protein
MELSSFFRPYRSARRHSHAGILLLALVAHNVLAGTTFAQLLEPLPSIAPHGVSAAPLYPNAVVPTQLTEPVPPPPPHLPGGAYAPPQPPADGWNAGEVVTQSPYGVVTQSPPSIAESEVFEPCYETPPTGFEGCDDDWGFQLMPKSLIWHSYLAGPWEPRFASVWSNDRDRGWVWDVALGGRVGLCRWGSKDCAQPSGWEIQMEGAAFPRLDPNEQVDLEATDYRFGAPLVYGNGPYQMKFGFWHISSHLGDELMEREPTLERINFGRNAMAWGHSYYINPDLRLYGEIDWAWDSMYSETWNFQFGFDWAPILKAGNQCTPFVAMNVSLREELDYSGSFNAQAGWAWRHGADRRMFRVGIQYYDGGNQQFSFYQTNESKVGLGLWYDY